MHVPSIFPLELDALSLEILASNVDSLRNYENPRGQIS